MDNQQASQSGRRLALQQRLAPAYRAEFFETLAAACPGGLNILAGQPMPGEAMGPQASLARAGFTPTRNRYYFGGSLTLVWQAGWRAWLESWAPDALVVEANPRNLSIPRAAAWMHRRGKPVIGWGLGAPPRSGRLEAIQGALWRALLGQFDALITYSRQGADEFARLGYPAEKIFVAPNAVTRRPPQPPHRPELLQRKPVVLFVGRLQPRKRVDLLVRACAALPAARQPELWIAGDGPARPDLQALAGSAYPPARFFGDQRGGDVERLFAGADLFVLPGTGGLAVQQAMSAGLPVIAAEADGTQADLVRPENGWCLPPGDFSALVGMLNEALGDIPRLRRMGAASYRIVAQEVNVEAMVDVFLKALDLAGRKS